MVSSRRAAGRRLHAVADQILRPPASARRPAKPASSDPDSEVGRTLARLAAVVRGARRPLILTHDNPDPDSLASAVALAHLFRKRFNLESRVAYGGLVGRAENQAMIRELRLPLVPVSRVIFDEYDLLCLVDTQSEAANHSLPPRYLPDVVIDHHPLREGSLRARFSDLGGDCGSTSTMLTRYLMAAGVEPSPQVATALFYGIKSDTRDLGRETAPADEEAYLWLFPWVDKIELGRIEHPRLSPAYFQLLHGAIERARRYGDVLVTDLGRLYSPDLTAEIAERFLFIEGIRWSVALGSFHRDAFVSLRTNDGRLNAGSLIREVCAGLGGSSGGHASMAGARVPLPPGNAAAQDRGRRELRSRFLAAFGVPAGSRGHRLLEPNPRQPSLIGGRKPKPHQPYR
jgi:nanoRNase/pAp phosphatase (c-di-AMP/oligoRNAs hydrolase)